MYQTILFDLDGTLTDSGQGILNSVAYALEKMGIEEPDTTNLNRFIGPPLYESFSRFYQLSPE
ncbi:TPA: HAD hydrolase-like protein, partial [Streptococcus suis]